MINLSSAVKDGRQVSSLGPKKQEKEKKTQKNKYL